MNNGLLTQDEATALIGPHSDTLRDCVDRAWGRWLRHSDLATASRRSRASIVYDYIAEEVESAFAETPGVSLTWRHGSLHMTVDSAAVIKFKKFRGRRLGTSGISTNARNRFLCQAGVLNGMVVTNLVVGYLLDGLEQSPETIAVTCPMDQGNLWTLDLGPSFDEGIIPVPMHVEDPGEGGTTIRSTEVAANENDDTAINEE